MTTTFTCTTCGWTRSFPADNFDQAYQASTDFDNHEAQKHPTTGAGYRITTTYV